MAVASLSLQALTDAVGIGHGSSCAVAIRINLAAVRISSGLALDELWPFRQLFSIGPGRLRGQGCAAVLEGLEWVSPKYTTVASLILKAASGWRRGVCETLGSSKQPIASRAARPMQCCEYLGEARPSLPSALRQRDRF